MKWHKHSFLNKFFLPLISPPFFFFGERVWVREQMKHEYNLFFYGRIIANELAISIRVQVCMSFVRDKFGFIIIYVLA